MATFIMQSVAFIALPSQVLLPYRTDDNLLEGSCSILR